MTWGMNVIGLADILADLDAVDIEFGTDRVYVVGTNVEYAVYQEFGTSDMPAQPHLRPAVRAAVRDIEGLAAQADDADDLIRLLALDIERRTKQRAPVDTGRLRASYKAERIE